MLTFHAVVNISNTWYRYKENNEARSLVLQKQLRRYASVSLTAEVVNFLQF